MIIIILLLFIILVLLGIIISSHQADEIEQQMKSYEDTKKEEENRSKLNQLGCYSMYLEQLDIWANQGVITKEEWEKEREIINKKVEEMENEVR